LIDLGFHHFSAHILSGAAADTLGLKTKIYYGPGDALFFWTPAEQIDKSAINTGE
jgi:hypothetical protein